VDEHGFDVNRGARPRDNKGDANLAHSVVPCGLSTKDTGAHDIGLAQRVQWRFFDECLTFFLPAIRRRPSSAAPAQWQARNAMDRPAVLADRLVGGHLVVGNPATPLPQEDVELLPSRVTLRASCGMEKTRNSSPTA
jgi:hypothetical protein